ncbi:MAG: ABC transporter substrate-binding protein [Geitlerinemataceae cyanobacterium]
MKKHEFRDKLLLLNVRKWIRSPIANDDNNPEIAKQIASEFVKNSDILGVIGPYASDVTSAAGTIYNSGKLVTISPVSTSVKLSTSRRGS